MSIKPKNDRNFFGVRCFTWLLGGLIQTILAQNQLPRVKFTPRTLQKTVLAFSHSRPLGERTIAAVETTNGWISMDIDWIWLGYIQEGLLVPFGPSIIASRGSWGARIGLNMP